MPKLALHKLDFYFNFHEKISYSPVYIFSVPKHMYNIVPQTWVLFQIHIQWSEGVCYIIGNLSFDLQKFSSVSKLANFKNHL